VSVLIIEGGLHFTMLAGMFLPGADKSEHIYVPQNIGLFRMCDLILEFQIHFVI